MKDLDEAKEAVHPVGSSGSEEATSHGLAEIGHLG